MSAGEDESLGRIEATRRVMRKAAALCTSRGAAVEDVAIGMLYAAFDVAEQHAGEGVAAVEWLRTACDVLEEAVFQGVRRGAAKPN